MSLRTHLKEILGKKVATMNDVKSLQVVSYMMNPPIPIRDTLTSLQEEMVVLEVKTHMVLLVENGQYANTPDGRCNGNHSASTGSDGGLAR